MITKFKTYAEWLETIDNGSFDDCLQTLVQQLEEGFRESLLDKDLISSFKIPIIKEHKLLPIIFHKKILYLGQSKSLYNTSKSRIDLGCSIRVFPISERLYEAFIQDVLTPRIVSHEVAGDQKIGNKTRTNIIALNQRSAPEEGSVSDVFYQILSSAYQMRASDIHIEPQELPEVLVRFRIDGLLHPFKRLYSSDFDYRTRLLSKIKVAANLDISETRIPQDGRITESVRNEKIDLRINTLPSLHGEKIVVRILPHKNPFTSLEVLGLEGKGLLTYAEWLKHPQGLILLTGQTGSGKTSSLYTSLSLIQNHERNIVTIEDPVEYQLPGITQVQVNPKVGMTFANGLRAILRQDPDIILLGEIRDYETTEIAYQASLTGHLVLSTLHTNDAPSAIVRLLDIQVEPYLIASATLGIVAQRLLRKLCTKCSEPYIPDISLLTSLGIQPSDNYSHFRRAVGCEHCLGTGYFGREGIFEVMPIDDTIRSLIMQKEKLQDLRTYLEEQNIDSLYDAAIKKIQLGITTTDEMYRVVPPSQFLKQGKKKHAAQKGSVLLLSIFLVIVLSIAWLGIIRLHSSSISALAISQRALKSFYLTDSGIRLGKRLLSETFDDKNVYLVKPQNAKSLFGIDSRRLDIVEQLGKKSKVLLLHENPFIISTTYHCDSGLKTSASAPGVPEFTDSVNAPEVLVRNYSCTIKSTPFLARSSCEPIAAPQLLETIFEIQSGPMPVSFFQNYWSSEPISEGKAGSAIKFPFSEKIFYVSDSGFGAIDNVLQMPSSIWPNTEELSNAHNPSNILTVEMDSSFYKSHVSRPWKISINGNVERLFLEAPNDYLQRIVIVQLLMQKQKSDQEYSVRETVIDIDSRSNRTLARSQKLKLSLDDKGNIKTKQIIDSKSMLIQAPFSGLVEAYGKINQLSGAPAAYNIPLSIFASESIGIEGDIRKADNGEQAILGVVSPTEGIEFHAIQDSPVAEWRSINNKPSGEIHAALIAKSFSTPPNKISLTGSIASLSAKIPQNIQVRHDKRFNSLRFYPPFFPRFQSPYVALITTTPPIFRQWREEAAYAHQ